MSDNIHEGHRERLREKFLKTGFSGFADHEKLELLLTYARPRVNTNGIAHDLLKKFKTIGGVFDASVEQLMEVNGIKEASAILIKIIPEMSKEYINSKSQLMIVNSSGLMCDFFKNQFIGEKNEKIMIACVDDKLRLVNFQVISEGSPSSATVDIKKLIEFTYKNNCESIIMAHNHPNGELMPSDNDLRVTEYVYKLLEPIKIRLLDHIIVAGAQAISLKELGAFSFV